MSRFSLALSVSACVTLAGCATDIGPTDLPDTETLPLSAWVGPNPDPANVVCTAEGCAVAPTGDLTGVADANNIEYALYQVGSAGTEVVLTDGDASSIDEYFVSRNIVTVGFSGTLRGEGMDNTIINAVRKSPAPGDGFKPAPSQYYGGDLLYPNVLQFDYAVGSWAIRDLSAHVTDPAPVDEYTLLNGDRTTQIWTLVEALGGDHSATIENVRLRGAGTYPTNTFIGMHVMLGELGAIPGTGVLRVRNLHLENILWGTLFMFFEDSMFEIADVSADVWRDAIFVGPTYNSTAVVSGADIRHSWHGIYLDGGFRGGEISGNTISSQVEAIVLSGVSNASVTGNTIRGRLGLASIRIRRHSNNNRIAYNVFENLDWQSVRGRGGIWVTESSGNTIDHNDFVKSNLPGWTSATPKGPGAIWLGPLTSDNSVFEMKFPPETGKTLCAMVLDMSDDPATTEYDGTNDIHAWQPCENLAERDAQKLTQEDEPTPLRIHQ